MTAFVPSNYVFGTGRIDGRRMVVGGDDFTVRGGAADAAIGNKMAYSERLALGLKLPMIRLVDGTGGGGSVKTLEMSGRTYVPANPGWQAVVDLSGRGAGGGCVSRPGRRTRSRARRHRAFLGDGEGIEPAVRRRAPGGRARRRREGGQGRTRRFAHSCAIERRGGQRSRRASRRPSRISGDSFRTCRRTSTSAAAGATADDLTRREEELLSVIPRERRRSYNIRRAPRTGAGAGSFFESRLITAARWRGAGAARRIGRRHGQRSATGRRRGECRGSRQNDSLHRPLRYLPPAVREFVDQSGLPHRQPGGTGGDGAHRRPRADGGLPGQVPWISILLRRAFGVAGAAHGNAEGLNCATRGPRATGAHCRSRAECRRQIGGRSAASDPTRAAAALKNAWKNIARRCARPKRLGSRRSSTRGTHDRYSAMGRRSAYGLLPAQLGPKRRKMRV